MVRGEQRAVSVALDETVLLSGMPVLVVDEKDARERLAIGDRFPLGSFDWRPRVGVATESVKAAEAVMIFSKRMIESDVIECIGQHPGEDDQPTPPEPTVATTDDSDPPKPTPKPSAKEQLKALTAYTNSPNKSLAQPSKPPVSTEVSAPSLVNLYRCPFAYIYLLTAADLEAYRDAGPRRRLRSFIETCLDRKAEYIILYSPSNSSVTSPSVENAHRKVLDKVRSEANTSKAKDHAILIRNPHEIQTELVPKMREIIRDAVEARVHAYEDDIFRIYANRLLPGWSFYSFFGLKEGLAFVYCQFGRRDLALRCYDELTATMTERDEQGSSFSAEPFNDAAPGVINPTDKPYRKLIANSQISELDFRSYLFARQANLLLGDKKLAELAERGKKFIAFMSRRISEETNREGSVIPANFRHSWTFCAARALVSFIEPLLLRAPQSGELFNSARDRTTSRAIAGFYVQAMKSFSFLASQAMPETTFVSSNGDGALAEKFSTGPAANGHADQKGPEGGKFSDSSLTEALESIEAAQKMLSGLTANAMRMCDLGGRPRGATTLSGNAGRVRLRNKSFEEAVGLLARQCNRYAEDGGWDDLHVVARTELAAAEQGLEQYQEYLVSCLSILAMYRNARRLVNPRKETADESSGDAQTWASAAANTAKLLSYSGFKYKLDKLMQVRLVPQDALWAEGNPAAATLIITSDIPASIEIDSIAVSFRARSKGRTMSSRGFLRKSKSMIRSTSQFSADTFDMTYQAPLSIRHGESQIEVSTGEVPWPGTYSACNIIFMMGKLKLIRRLDDQVVGPVEGDPEIVATVMEHRLARRLLYRASPRPDSVVIEIKPPSQLFFVPEAIQYVSVSVTAGPTGLATGSAIDFVLLVAEDTISAASLRFVGHEEAKGTFTGDASALLEVTVNDDVPLEAQVTVGQNLGSSESFTGKLAIAVSYVEPVQIERKQNKSTKEVVVDNVFPDFQCSLQVVLNGSELQEGARNFECTSVTNLDFYRPAQVVSTCRRTGDGTALVNCRLISRNLDDFLVFKEVQLSLPRWALLESASPPHQDMLPLSLGSNTGFEIVFGVKIILSVLNRVRKESKEAGEGEDGELVLDDEAELAAPGVDHVEDTSGLLRFGFEREEVDGELLMEGMLDLSELFSADRRFIVQANCRQETTVGSALEIQFEVSLTATERARHGDTVILYSVEIDQEDCWLLAGQKRGEMKLSDGRGAGRIRAVPLTPGRLQIPRIEILESGGEKVVGDLVVNQRTSDQVWVLPKRGASSQATFESW